MTHTCSQVPPFLARACVLVTDCSLSGSVGPWRPALVRDKEQGLAEHCWVLFLLNPVCERSVCSSAQFMSALRNTTAWKGPSRYAPVCWTCARRRDLFVCLFAALCFSFLTVSTVFCSPGKAPRLLKLIHIVHLVSGAPEIKAERWLVESCADRNLIGWDELHVPRALKIDISYDRLPLRKKTNFRRKRFLKLLFKTLRNAENYLWV